MSVSIDSIGPATNAKWDEVWEKCSYGTYFHSREWAEIWNVYSKRHLRPEPLLFRFSDGLEAIFPLSVSKSYRGLFEEYVSSPAGTFGGWISEERLTNRHATLMTGYVRDRKAGLILRLNPYDETSASIQSEGSVPDVTYTLDLRPGFDAVYREISKGHRSAAKKAARSGVTIEQNNRHEDWDEHFAVYEDSLRRWGSKATSRYAMSLFSEMRRRNSPNIKLWLAKYQGQAIAGAVCLYAPSHVAYWQGAAMEQYFNLRGPNLLIEEAIRHASQQGYSWFDFNPSGGHEGPTAFKEHFGTKPLPCPTNRTRKFALRAFNKIRSKRWIALPQFIRSH
jgi:hypothetical protein